MWNYRLEPVVLWGHMAKYELKEPQRRQEMKDTSSLASAWISGQEMCRMHRSQQGRGLKPGWQGKRIQRRNWPDRKPFICFLRDRELVADFSGHNHLKAGGLRQNQMGAPALDFHFAGIHLFCIWTSPFIPTNDLYLAKLQIPFVYDKWGLLFLPKNMGGRDSELICIPVSLDTNGTLYHPPAILTNDCNYDY